MKNRSSKWLVGCISLLLLLAFIYALPNVFGESPSLQISSASGAPLSADLNAQVTAILAQNKIVAAKMKSDKVNLILKFASTDAQMAAKEVLSPGLGPQYEVALNLTPDTPSWLLALGASPMKYGLDLRGGMYFLLDVDMPVVVQTHMQRELTLLMNGLRTANIHYASINLLPTGIVLSFDNSALLNAAKDWINTNDTSLSLTTNPQALSLTANLTPLALKALQDNALDQTLQVMRNRVNELGVAEASVAKQNSDRIVIELPGVQDATRAQAIIGGTATLKAMMVNDTVDPVAVATHHSVPVGSSLYYDQNNNPIVLFSPVVLTGDAISNASVGYDPQTSAPIVNVTLTGPQVNYFAQVTGANVGHRMAIVLVQSTFTTTTEKVINAAVIQSQLGNAFQISGIGSARAAQNLALSIRAGALPAPVQIAEEKQLGPSLGLQNIKMGALSVVVALSLIMVFISVYYRILGVIAALCLLINLILIVAVMSLIPGATLTLPGIAGMVLNVGMAIDANVLIFERIREELRRGATSAIAIHTGYERAFATILDANVTTFIVAVILFAIGSGSIKGFAVTLMIGILTSVFTAVVVGRLIVNALYGHHKNAHVSIGI